ncbi:MAG: hybrid sensor histidine kinase/response regulator [Pseudomonadota bacterium]
MSAPTEHILLVDDEERVLSALRRRLRTEFQIHTASSGAQALTALDNEPAIAVVVADMQMPGMNGIELLRAVQDRFPKVRRIMLTGNADLETAIAAINEGKVDRFLRKPCEASELSAAIHQALSEYAFQQRHAEPSPEAPRDIDTGRIACDAFVTLVCRNLRAPLSEIAALEGALEKHPPRAHHAESFDKLVQLKRSGESMLRLIDRVLDFSRLRSEAPDLDPIERADVIEILTQEVEAIRFRAARTDVTLQVNSLRRTALVQANEEELRLALRELLSNAVKFSAGKGHISAMVKCEGQSVAVSIINGGWGVSPVMEELMERPFWQTGPGLASPSEQIGLGLARVATIAELNHARFTIKALPKGGSQAILIFERVEERSNLQDAPTKLAG